MSKPIKFDFAIIGGGMAGASLAARLAPRANVLLLETEQFSGYHSTGRSAALYSALYGNPPIQALTRASRGFFDAPPAGFTEHPLLTRRGVLYAGGAEHAQAVAEIARSPLARQIESAQAREMVSVLREETSQSVAYEPDACDVDVNALHQGFLRMAKAAGATVVNRAQTTALAHNGGWHLTTSGGDFTSDVIVNAAGAWADTVATLAGAQPLGLQPLLRTAINIDGPAGVDVAGWPAVIAADESFYFKPDAGVLLASPADETPCDPCDAQAEELSIAICVDRIERATTLSVARVRRSWAGLRTFAPDRTPVVGYDDLCPGFFWLAGHGGYGIQTAPALSQAAASLAMSEFLPGFIEEEGLTAAELAPGRLRAL